MVYQYTILRQTGDPRAVANQTDKYADSGSSQFSSVNLDLATITGPGIGIDRSGNIYVGSSAAGTVSVFAPGQTGPSRTISPLGAYGLTWVMPKGAIYQASGE